MDAVDAVTQNPYKCRLTLLAPSGKCHMLDRILSSLTTWVDPSQQIVSVEERSGGENHSLTPKGVIKLHGCLVTPAISVMLFMRETGKMCAKDVDKILKKSPFKFHHKVELQNRNAPSTVVGKHEFYKLADDLPLFATCPVLTEKEHLRINMYVHKFIEMMEFYRLITDTEIESQKPEFCIFQLYQQPGLDIQLSLKRSQYICPVPVESAYVSFNVKNIEVVLGISEVTHVTGNVYTTRDPDGNLVVLYETNDQHRERGLCTMEKSCCCDSNQNLANGCMDSVISLDDLKSLKSVKSHDSGRYSDMDGASMRHENTDISETSEGYASSSNTNSTYVALNKADKGKAPKSGKKIVKGKTVKVKPTDDKSKSMKSVDNGIRKQDVTPVYI